jgi:hypothetical protein
MLLLCVNVQANDETSNIENPFIYKDFITLSNPGDAKVRIQLDYALKVAQQMILYLDAYAVEHGKQADTETFDNFAKPLLNHDPFIQCVDYQPQTMLNLAFTDSISISPILSGLTFTYLYQVDTWRFSHYKLAQKNVESTDSDASMAADIAMVGLGVPYHLDVLYAYGIITHHCQTPIGYRVDNSKLLDDEWCPAWHDAVMSP